jgi:ribosomal protein S18 acetylase RimI-like enzyme
VTDSNATFRPLEPSELAAFQASSRGDYLEDLERSGMSKKEAEKNAEASFARMFPNGTLAPGQHIGRVIVAGEEVGVLWIGLTGDEADRWFVYYVEIDADKRGRGFGREAMLLAESFAREHGAATLGLNVFAFNTIARSLYQSLGYEESAVQMRKTL